MIQLRVLGPLELRGHDGQAVLSILTRPKRLTLLSYLTLAASGTFVRRAKLVELFWPESDRDRARASLRTALSGLRASLGPDVLTSRGDDELGIALGSVSCDVLDFEAAMREGDLTTASSLYRGPLLEGVSLPRAPPLNRWLEEQRTRLARAALEAAVGLSERSEGIGELRESVEWARRALSLEPFSELGLRRLMRLLDESGDREGAVLTYEGFVARLAEELDLEPSTETTAVANSIRSGRGTQTTAGLPDLTRPGVEDVESSISASPLSPSRAHPAAAGGLGSRLGTATLAVAALVIGLILWGSFRPSPSSPVVRYSLVMADGEELSEMRGRRLAISPDGSDLVYVSGQNRSLRLRERDQLHAPELPGTQGARSPFFSPDGTSVGFISDGLLKVTSLRSGRVTVVTNAIDPWGGVSWGPDGYLYMNQPGFGGVFRVVPQPGATPEPVTVPDPERNESTHEWPDVLPNGRGVLFTAVHAGLGVSTYAIAVTDLEGGPHRYVAEGIYARYAPSGHLLYVSVDGTLMVAPFDADNLEVTGPATVVSPRLQVGFRRAIDLGISETGTLAYATAREASASELVWVNRDGQANPLDPPWRGDLTFPSLSPDGSRLAVVVSAPGQADVWIRDLASRATTRLTVDEAVTGYPSWTPDGESVTYFWNTGTRTELWTKSASDGSQAIRQLEEGRDLAESLWSPDGEWLIFRTSNVPSRARSPSEVPVAGAADIFAHHLGTDSAPLPIATSEFAELAPSLSPDGNWLAYASAETGKEEVFVVPFPDVGSRRWSVSPEGGAEPVWSPAGGELFYRDLRGRMMAVAVGTGPEFSIGPATVLFDARPYVLSGLHKSYDVARDGSRFLLVRQPQDVDPGEVIMVENWFTELEGRR